MDIVFDRLDKIAIAVAKGDSSAFGILSTGEQLYMALAANDVVLLFATGYTIPEAIARLGPEWTESLVERWRYRGNPKLLTA